MRTPCGHEFCKPCLDRLLRTAYRHSCPMCRAELSAEFIDSLHGAHAHARSTPRGLARLRVRLTPPRLALADAEDAEENRAWLRDVRAHMRLSGRVAEPGDGTEGEGGAAGAGAGVVVAVAAAAAAARTARSHSFEWLRSSWGLPDTYLGWSWGTNPWTTRPRGPT